MDELISAMATCFYCLGTASLVKTWLLLDPLLMSFIGFETRKSFVARVWF